MKHSDFPKKWEIPEFFYDFTDDVTLGENCTVGSCGYQYFELNSRTSKTTRSYIPVEKASRNNDSNFVFVNEKNPSDYNDMMLGKIEDGTIPAYPYIFISFGGFYESKLDILIECIDRFYQATGFRPIGDINTTGYVDEETGDIVNICNMDSRFYKVSDVQYMELFRVSSLKYGDFLLKKFSKSWNK